ncbi:uncharacterized protein LOC129765656 [Toxorhynchites rutilus septentrionalis]|uniref:uncharacterized protein LOC129765656 n=1 Tax=Toxorhynchites rutilus septentrionalis TaxID=329112 RepID=UPI0024787441|nr:uncharacterized protein LOC129765656 [Toxorhynchites rutilus septentrionalis]
MEITNKTNEERRNSMMDTGDQANAFAGSKKLLRSPILKQVVPPGPSGSNGGIPETQQSRGINPLFLPKSSGSLTQEGGLTGESILNTIMIRVKELDTFVQDKPNVHKEIKTRVSGIRSLLGRAMKEHDGLVERTKTAEKTLAEALQKAAAGQPLRSESASALSDLADEFEKHVQILDSLETKAQHWDSVLVELLFSRMDTNAQKLWENQRDKTQRPSYEGLIKFIHEYSRTLQSLQLSQTAISFGEDKELKPRTVVSHSPSEHTTKCVACKQSHYLFQCELFRSQTPQQRFESVKRSGLCINCLKATHLAKYCSSGSCKYCQKKHHTLLHLSASPTLIATETPQYMQPVSMLQQQPQNANQMSHPSVALLSDFVGTFGDRSVSSSSPSVFAPFPASYGTVASSSKTCQTVTPVPVSDSTVLLFTALVKVRDNLGQYQVARALLDSGSQSNFISESLCQRLALSRSKVNLPVSGIGQAVVNVRYSVSVELSSRHGLFEQSMECLVLPKLTISLPTRTVDVHTWKIPNNIPLADPQFNVSNGIDIIVGAELFSMILQAEQITFNEHLPVLQKTSLGYVIAGKVPTSTPSPVTCLISTLDHLDTHIKKFWEVEDFDHCKAYTAEEQQCETHFMNTHSRNADGRYVVRLPVRREMLPLIGETWSAAARRFSSVPHHAISRPDSTTTKTRVVFDGSCKSTNHLSLNDLLLTGPTVQPTLLSIVLNFRFHRYVMTADIEKMYRQIMVHPEDRPLQQILWRQLESDPMKAYFLNTVTYGTSCAPFLATRTLNQLAEDEGEDFPLAKPIVRQDFDVDDVLTGSDSLDNWKWSANHPKILEHIAEEDLETLNVLELDQTSSIKTLGLFWFPAEDMYGFKVPQLPTINRITKRIALSEMSQIFDPLGLVGPVVASAKMFLQRLWQLNLDWVDELPDQLQSWWLSFRASLATIKGLRIPRWVRSFESDEYELHCFTDASEKGYGCCIYVVSAAAGFKTSHLLIAKSRVAPTSGLSIPRLELCAAVLGSQLADSVLHTTKFAGKLTFGTDSTIVLHWINTPSSTWKVFVSNRVAEIQRLTKGFQWRHVPTTDNPADCISRGAEPQHILQDNLWWHGPSFLLFPPQNWPNEIVTLSPSLLDLQATERKVTVALHVSVPDDSLIHAYSELAPLLRITAYCKRFAFNCKTTKTKRNTGNITVDEYDSALKTLVRLAQHTAFNAELQYLKSKNQAKPSLKDVQFKSPIKNLDHMFDSNGLLRIHGRLAELSNSYDSRFPMVLPADHQLSKLIARSIHHQTLHAGPTQLLATIRQRFWPIRGRDLVRRTVHRCVTCFRCRPKASEQYMAPLPASRITPAKVFEHTGLDYCGPFLVRPLAGRGASVKVWVAVYVCFAVKAVVLDIVAGLSAAACVNSLRRFVSRVGRVRVVHCDNSTSFIGAIREVKEMRQKLIEQLRSNHLTNECLEEGIEFQFIPPRAPHFGGLWEAAVKAFKYHFQRIMGSSPYHMDDLRTAIAQAECMMNSRPLTPLSNHPEDLSVLTPAHFLLGEPAFRLPEPDYSNTPINRLSRFQASQRSINDLWKRWSKEYISLLHQRPAKWRSTPTLFTIGSMVLLKKDNAPPKQWPLGRVVAVYPNVDGIIRVVDVRTQAGIRRRATTELCLLPIDVDNTYRTDCIQPNAEQPPSIICS